MESTNSQQASPINRFALVLTAIATAVLWQLPGAKTVLWPLTLLATWAHEMGHALAAMGLANFEDLQLFPNGGGVARFRKFADASFANATIAAAGLLGPAIAGSILILCARTYKGARSVLLGLSVCLLLSAVFCVRWTDLFSLFVLGAWAASLMYLAIHGGDLTTFLTAQFLGLQFAINSYKDIDYMFSPSVILPGGKTIPSDSAMISQELGNFLPYWFWGGATAIFSIFLLLASVFLVFTKKIGTADSEPAKP